MKVCPSLLTHTGDWIFRFCFLPVRVHSSRGQTDRILRWLQENTRAVLFGEGWKERRKVLASGGLGGQIEGLRQDTTKNKKTVLFDTQEQATVVYLTPNRFRSIMEVAWDYPVSYIGKTLFPGL